MDADLVAVTAVDVVSGVVPGLAGVVASVGVDSPLSQEDGKGRNTNPVTATRITRPEDEIGSLRDEAKYMKNELDAINKRIEELEKEA